MCIRGTRRERWRQMWPKWLMSAMIWACWTTLRRIRRRPVPCRLWWCQRSAKIAALPILITAVEVGAAVAVVAPLTQSALKTFDSKPNWRILSAWKNWMTKTSSTSTQTTSHGCAKRVVATTSGRTVCAATCAMSAVYRPSTTAPNSAATRLTSTAI